jgi:hypothetical protein
MTLPGPYRIRGVTYIGAQAAADALGVRSDTVYHALQRGKEQTLGLGSGSQSHLTGGTGHRPFKIGSITYDSERDASKALGRNAGYVSRVLLRGSPKARALLQARMMQHAASLENIIRAKRERNRRNAIFL